MSEGTASTGLNIGIVGASGAVGADLLRLMRAASFPVGTLKLFGARNSAGDVHEYAGRQHVVRPFKADAAADLDLLVCLAPPAASARIVSEAVAAGVFTIDASAASRAREDVPLVVAPVNRAALEDAAGLVATPGALATALALVLGPLVDGPGLAEVEATALLAVTVGGRAGMNELSRQVVSILNQKPFESERFPRQVAFSLIPWFEGDAPPEGADGGVGPPDDGLSGEERRTLAELRRVVPGLPEATGLTVALAPVFVGHSVALTLRLDAPRSAAEVTALVAGAPGVELHEGAGAAAPASVDAAERDEVLASRLRVDPLAPDVVRLFLTFDNLRIAARNLLLVLEALREDGMV